MGFVEIAETLGQLDILAADVLPVLIFDDCGQPADRSVFEQMGIVFGNEVEGNPLFVNCTLPSGWRKEASNQAEWTYLLDEKGRQRVRIFYKAVSYDSSAHMTPVGRIYLSGDYTFATVMDGEVELFRTENLPLAGQNAWVVHGKARRAAEAWTHFYFPDWENVLAYWDVDDLTSLLPPSTD